VSSVAGVLLAAGLSTRMGTTKALLDWQGVPLVVFQAQQLRTAGCDPVIVVVGHDAARLRAALIEQPVTIVENGSFRSGRASSVRTGAEAVDDAAGAVVLLNVDQPRRGALIAALIAARLENDAAIATPTFDGHGGHPAVFAGRLLPELRAVDDSSQGLRAVVTRHARERLLLPWEDAEVLLDLNDAAAYETARSLWASPPGTR
jgi:CTP:molybdopterin cytidylyltransferase MocA